MGIRKARARALSLRAFAGIVGHETAHGGHKCIAQPKRAPIACKFSGFSGFNEFAIFQSLGGFHREVRSGPSPPFSPVAKRDKIEPNIVMKPAVKLLFDF